MPATKYAEKNLMIALQLPKEITLSKIEEIFKTKLTKSIDASYFCEISDGKSIFFYKFSAIVFFGFSPEEVSYYHEQIIQGAMEKVTISDTYTICIDPTLEKDSLLRDKCITIREGSMEFFEIIAFSLAHTVAMEYYEQITEKFFQKANFYDDMKQFGKIRLKEKALLKSIADLLSIKHKIVNELYLFDMPDIVWDDLRLERLYKSLYAFFDINDRFKAIEYKLNFMSENITFLYDVLDTRKAHTMELIVIFLISFEIVFTLIEFVGKHFMGS